MEGARAATRHDVPAVVALVEQGIAELSPMKGGAVWAAREATAPPYDHALVAAIDDPDRQVLVVGTVDDVVVGYARACVEDLRDGSRLGVVREIFVDEGARGVGVGEAMLEHVVAWLRDAGCAGVDAMALPGHRAAKNFFEGAGFTAREIVMHHRLREA